MRARVFAYMGLASFSVQFGHILDTYCYPRPLQDPLRTSDFDFELPGSLIAQSPVEPRDAARLLVRPGVGSLLHASVRDLPGLLRAGDLLVLNDTKVLPARVFATRATGGRVECLFLEPDSPESEFLESRARVEGNDVGVAGKTWSALVRPAKKLRPGEILDVLGREGVDDSDLRIEMVERSTGDGTWRVRLFHASTERSVEDLLAEVGAMPLPPYIDRPATPEDGDRYQTIFAESPGAVAAPTAGLHFTPTVFDELAARGIEWTTVTLHVGPGTFLPVTADRIADHHMHSERFTLDDDAARAVERCRERGGRVIPIGTTSARVLESCARSDPRFERAIVTAKAGRTEIFIHPGNEPRVADGLFTNFHLPKSTLLMLVAAFIGRMEMLRLYRVAIDEAYRFYSYGDAMLLLPDSFGEEGPE